jgi:hypothetical protein
MLIYVHILMAMNTKVITDCKPSMLYFWQYYSTLLRLWPGRLDGVSMEASWRSVGLPISKKVKALVWLGPIAKNYTMMWFVVQNSK